MIQSQKTVVREGAGVDEQTRIEHIKAEGWISYPCAEEILGKMEELLVEPGRSKMPTLLVIGGSNSGKTSVVKEFWRKHPPTDGLFGDAYPVIYVQAPPVPDEKRFYDAIFSLLMVPFRRSDTPSQKLVDVIFYFKKIGTRMLIVDEIHNVLTGSHAQQRAFMNALKNLGNEMMIPIVLVGTKETLEIAGTDLWISNRFKPLHLPLWEFDKNLIHFLSNLETTLPLKKCSGLTSEELAREIHRLSEGQVGEVVNLVNEAAIIAIKSGSEKVSMKEIKEVGFIPPSLRRSSQPQEQSDFPLRSA